MNIIQKIRNAFRAADISQIQRVVTNNNSGIQVTKDTAMRSAAVYACIALISESVAQLPFILYRKSKSGRERATDHPLYRLLHDAPNSYQTSLDFRQMLTASMLIHGSAYAFINRAGGRIIELLPLDSRKMQVEQNKDWSLSYRYDNEPVEASKILRLTGLSLNGYTGISPIQYHSQTIGLALAADRYGAMSFKNGAKLSGILEHPTSFRDPEIAKRVAQSWDEKFNNGGAFSTPLLEDGLKYTPISMTNKDAAYIETKRFQIEEIARIFRVQPHKIGDLTRSTNNNIEQQSLEFVQDTLMPWLRRWEQSIARDLITDDVYPEILVDGLLRADASARATFYQTAVGAPWMTINEARQRENMNIIEGGDTLLTPLNLGANDNATQSSDDSK